ncbi:putative 4-hydroxybenzoate octaprenyltransferase [Methanocella arvoryzae MRE50]|uniref:4-hydroxybenzoate octaprenyltransferase n=2 Tax=Methanocella TaxID=570266 RepID=Q0W869_METAR|nr:putative 4-hydroxybenzoate octaprenyltransferase [Methanocella arvoryzae MRE50]
MAKARALSDLVRTELPLSAGICVVAGEILALGGLPSLPVAILGFATGFFISGSAMITNEYFDLEVDRINHPDRPLPSGRVSILEMAVMAALFSVAGLVAAALLSPLLLAVAVLLLVIGILYNWKLKESGLPGNMMVAVSVGMTFICGGMAAGRPMDGVVWTFGAMAFLFDLAEEIAGTAMDMEGDRQRGARTLALMYGRQPALRASMLLFAGFIGLSLLPYLAGWLGYGYLAAILLADTAIAYLAFGLYRSLTPREGRAKMRRLYLTMTDMIVVILLLTAANLA